MNNKKHKDPSGNDAPSGFTPKQSSFCDKCGLAILPEKSVRMETSLTLCIKCHDQLKSVPDGTLKSIIENHLSGNVL